MNIQNVMIAISESFIYSSAGSSFVPTLTPTAKRGMFTDINGSTAIDTDYMYFSVRSIRINIPRLPSILPKIQAGELLPQITIKCVENGNIATVYDEETILVPEYDVEYYFDRDFKFPEGANPRLIAEIPNFSYDSTHQPASIDGLECWIMITIETIYEGERP